MRKRWNEFVGGNTGSTIGNDYFPAYKLYVTDSTGKKTELKDGFTAGTPQLMVQVEAPGSGGSSSSYKLGCEAYADTNSNPPKKVGIDAKGNWMLKPGKNQLGIWIFSLADNKAEYVDFKYIDVYYGSLVIVPDFKEPGPLNTPLKLYAKFQDENVPLPANVRYEWSTGTGKELGKGPANYVTVKSSTEGEFIVVVKLYDAAKNELLWEAQRAVQIKAQGTTPPPGPGIDLSKAEWCAFQAEYIISLVVEGETATSGFSTTEIFPDVMRGKIVGNTFTGQGKVKGTYGGSSDATITVTLDPSFKQVTSFRFSCSGADVVEGVDVQTNLEISGSNLPYLEPFNQGKGNGHRYGITGREACRHITTKMTQRLTHEGGTQTYPLKSFECNDASGVTIVLGWGD